MRPTDIVFNQLGLPDEEHAKECPHCAGFREEIIKARAEVERMQDASDISKFTAEQFSCQFRINVIVDPSDMDEINVMIEGLSQENEPLVEQPDEGRAYTLSARAKAVTDAILNLWSTLYTTNEANERISEMYDKFDEIREGEHAPTSTHLN